MTYTSHDKLPIITIKKEIETIPVDFIFDFLQGCPANIIYVELGGHLLGLFSSGTIHRALLEAKTEVKIRRNFTKVMPGEYMKALQIFQSKDTINAIPIVTADSVLLGEYSRWNGEYALLFQEKYSGLLQKCNLASEFWSSKSSVYMVKPAPLYKWKTDAFNRWREYLDQVGVHTVVVNRVEADNINILYGGIFILVDEDEKKSFVESRRSLADRFIDLRRDVYTFSDILACSRMLDGKNRIGRFLASHVLTAIQKSGVRILTLTADEDGSAEARSMCNALIKRKELVNGYECESFSIAPIFWQTFFDDLYSPEYAETIATIKYYTEVKNGAYNLKDTQSTFLNVIDNRRVTDGQPSNYDREIFFFGPCFIYGHWVEDKNTIESFLQRLLNNNGAKYKVNNLGAPGNSVLSYLLRILETPLHTGDIIILYAEGDSYENIHNLNLMDILTETILYVDWFKDAFLHCNHRVNEIFATKICETLNTLGFMDNGTKKREPVAFDVSLLVRQYIENTFLGYKKERYARVGAIVVNCNPFTFGHLHLIKTALSQVEFLIIFVVEEDLSVFPFEMRLAFVRNGTVGLENVMVVPSGGFILSKTTFPEYFIKIADEDIIQNVEYDITLFAEQIAPRLGITCRFVGEEPEDGVTREYNEAMKRILPAHGIDLIEIPRLTLEGGQIVSATAVRRALEENDMEALDRLVPESTKEILFWENK